MYTLSFFGASGMVTGSCFRLTPVHGRPILIDFGMFQGVDEIESLNYKPLGFKPVELEAAVVTHAHLDHCGRLPLLIRGGFKGKIYMTEATASLVELVLQDSAKIGTYEGETALYTKYDVEKTLSSIETFDYHQVFTTGSFRVQFFDAGHVLGSSSIHVTDTSASGGFRTFVFSGDLGNSPEEIVRPTEYIPNADVVVMESTYGGRIHPKEDSWSILCKEINEVERSGGTLLIPAFALSRTQTLLHAINHLKSEKRVLESTPVFLDSPMAISATVIYGKFPKVFNNHMIKHARHENPLNFPGLAITNKPRKSKKIKKVKGPKVIIAGSGMMEGGRILAHAQEYLSRSNTRLLIVGYMGQETRGREIEEGAQVIDIRDISVPIRATITKIHGWSAHADENQLVNWLSHIRGVKKVFLVHGEDESRHALAAKIKKSTHIFDITIPHLSQECKV